MVCRKSEVLTVDPACKSPTRHGSATPVPGARRGSAWSDRLTGGAGASLRSVESPGHSHAQPRELIGRNPVEALANFADRAPLQVLDSAEPDLDLHVGAQPLV